jgi:hypothetical protein
MSLGFLSIVAGNLLTVAVGKLFRLEGSRWYWAFAVLGLAGALAFRAGMGAWRRVSVERGAHVAE